MSLAKLKEKYNPLQVVPGQIAQAPAVSSDASAPVSDTRGHDPEAKFTPADYDDHRDPSGAPVAYDAAGNRIYGDGPSIPQPQAHDLAHPSLRVALTSWQDSAPVSRLSIFMKEHGAAAGIRLVQSNGKPHLIFDPGLGCADMKTERWKIVNNITALLIDAVDDLKYLIANNLIDVPCKIFDGSCDAHFRIRVIQTPTFLCI